MVGKSLALCVADELRLVVGGFTGQYIEEASWNRNRWF
jgi:hypothetical protein